jgi:hypothetical protein
MWTVHNTTDLPTAAIYAIGSFVMEDIGLKDWVRSITLRNKQEGRMYGNYGNYIPSQQRITLCVPQAVENKSIKLQYIGARIFVRNKIEFVCAVLAHEFHHAYRHMTRHHYSLKYKQFRTLAEMDCEQHQIRVLDRFIQMIDGQLANAATGETK